jgi:hypothetical protein
MRIVKRLEDDMKNDMKKYFVVFVALLLGVVLSAGASMAADMSGTWTLSISNTKVTGMCPVGPNATGTCTITQSSGKFTLILGEGFECRPESMCEFSGDVNGSTYTCETTDLVDNEGGVVTRIFEFTFTSPTTATGKGTQKYTHPEGFECIWEHDITISK